MSKPLLHEGSRETTAVCVCLCVYTVYVQYLKVQGCSLVAATKVVVFF